jgi:hypothetical protein
MNKGEISAKGGSAFGGKNKKIKLFFLILCAGLFFVSNQYIVHAAPAAFEYRLLEAFPGFFTAGTAMNTSTTTDLPAMILAIYKFGIWTVGIAGLFMLVVGGFMYMASAGNTSTAGNARGIISDALLGIVAALGAYLILYVINPDLTAMKIGFTAVNVEEPEYGGSIIADNGNLSTSGGCIKPVKQARLQESWVYNQALKPQTLNGIRYTDCSNFVESAYTASGCSSPGSTTATMYPKAKAWSNTSQLKAGDAIVRYDGKGHVVLCMNDGCSQIIHSPGTGKPITIKNGSFFTSKSGKWANAKVIQASSYCGGC